MSGLKSSHKPKISYIAGAFIFGVICSSVFYFSFLPNKTQKKELPDEERQELSKEKAADFDKKFLEQMAVHHEEGIAMTEIALEKAEHNELKKLSEDIKKQQSEEVSKMRQWYKEWYKEEIPKTADNIGKGLGMGMMTTSGMKDSEVDLDKLKTVKLFDKEYILEMIPHQQMSLLMAKMALKMSDREDLRNLAQDIITAKTTEITQMDRWYGYWY